MKIPLAFAALILAVIFVEAGSHQLLQTMLQACRGGDLVQMDPDPFCRNFSKYEDTRTIPPPRPAACKPGTRYDVILVGSSVTQTGWVERLNDDGLSVCRTGLRFFERHGWNVFKEVEQSYPTAGDRPTILLFADLTERSGRRWDTMFVESENAYTLWPESQKKFEFSVVKLVNYIMEKRKLATPGQPRAEEVELENGGRLFYRADLNGAPAPEANEEGRRTLAERIKRVSERAREKNFILAIAALPTGPQMYEKQLLKAGALSEPYKRTNLKMLESAAQEAGVPFLNGEEALQAPTQTELEQGNWLWWRDDTHANERGNRSIAVAVKEFLTEILEKNPQTNLSEDHVSDV